MKNILPHYPGFVADLPHFAPVVDPLNAFASVHAARLMLEDKAEWDYSKCKTGEFIDNIRVRVQKSGGSLVKVDWLTVTFPEQDANDKLWAELYDLLTDCNMGVFGRAKGMHNYTMSAVVQFASDVSGTSTNVGHLAWGRQGLLFELSGMGCELLRQKLPELVNLIILYGGRLTRLDLALDLHGNFTESRKITVPTLLTRAKAGEFASKYAPEHCKQSIDLAGDWSDFACGLLNPEDYNPAEHCPKGLTAYIGGKTSENQFVIYEKGKQLLGLVDKDQYLEYSEKLQKLRSAASRSALIRKMEKLSYNPDFDHDRSWVRIERRIKRGSNKKDISLAMVLDPDGAFISGFPGMDAIYQDFRTDCQCIYRDFEEYRAEGLAKHESLLLTRKVFWGQRQYGRLVKTLQSEGLSAGDIVDLLGRSDGLKEYIFDLLEQR